MKKDAAQFWETVKKEIKLQNITQNWVAKKAGINFNTFQGWIAKGIFPRLDEGLRIANILNTPVERLALGPAQGRAETRGALHQHLNAIEKHLALIKRRIEEFE
ncbi:MAG: helix-turn-helix domain-containing protein [Treponema sp.]|nr:helix-turn-helix domain-containing protein [Treponema sp.]